MKVSAILAAKGAQVSTIRPDATILSVVHKFKLDGIGALVVSADGATLMGLISERDVVMGLAEQGGAVMEQRVAELMNRGVATCRPDDDIKAVMAKMTQRRVRHLPVVDEGLLVGIVSIGDVVKRRIEETEHEAEALRQYITAG